MNIGSRILIIALAIGVAGSTANSQTEILDIDALGQAFGFGQLTQDRTEFVYVREDLQGGSSTLFAASLMNPGASRQLPTQGIDVGNMRTFEYGGRILVSDPTIDGVYAVDLRGDSPPLPLSPEPGRGASCRRQVAKLALGITGDRFSTDPALRSALYAFHSRWTSRRNHRRNSALRDISTYRFSEDGNTLVVGTACGATTIPSARPRCFSPRRESPA